MHLYVVRRGSRRSFRKKNISKHENLLQALKGPLAPGQGDRGTPNPKAPRVNIIFFSFFLNNNNKHIVVLNIF